MCTSLRQARPFLVLFVLLPGAAVAQSGDRSSAPSSPAGPPLTMWLSHGESDNVVRAGGGRRAVGSYDSLGSTFNLLRNGTRISGGLNGDLEFRRYASDVADDERLGAVAGYADVVLVPRFFDWSFQDSYSQARIDPFGPNVPDNRQNVNVFTTQPRLMLPVGQRTRFTLSSRYSDRSYSGPSDIDSEALMYELMVERKVRQATTVGFSAQRTTIEPTGDSDEYDIEAAQLSYSRTLASGSAGLSFGVNQIMRLEAEQREPMVQLNWNRSFTATSSLSLSVYRGFTEAGRLLELSRSDDLTSSPIDVLLSIDATDRRGASLTYSLSFARTSVSIGGGYTEDRFIEDTTLDGEGREVNVDITRQITQKLTLGGSVRVHRRSFDDSAEVNDDRTYFVWVTRPIGQRLGLEFLAQRARLDGIGAFRETSYVISLYYTPGSGAL